MSNDVGDIAIRELRQSVHVRVLAIKERTQAHRIRFCQGRKSRANFAIIPRGIVLQDDMAGIAPALGEREAALRIPGGKRKSGRCTEDARRGESECTDSGHECHSRERPVIA